MQISKGKLGSKCIKLPNTSVSQKQKKLVVSNTSAKTQLSNAYKQTNIYGKLIVV